MCFESPQRRNSHNTLVPTKLSGRLKVRMCDAGIFQSAELSFSVVIARTSGRSVACRVLPASRDSTRASMLGRSLRASTPAPCLETTRVCDVVSRFYFSSQMCWAPPNYLTDKEISNSRSVA